MGHGDRWSDEASDAPLEPPRALTRTEAAALRQRLGRVSPWRVVAVQAVAGLVCAAVAWIVAPAGAAAATAWSALYGAAAVVLPGALFARGMTRGAGSPVAAAAGFLVWEMLKVGASVAMLVIAARVVPSLSWPALLLTMVVCIKVYWFALLWRGR